MVDVKVGDKFVRYHDWNHTVIETRVVTKVTDTSIYFENISKRGTNKFRVKNQHRDWYWMPVMKGFTSKDMYHLLKD